jgi:hypothetical protein
VLTTDVLFGVQGLAVRSLFPVTQVVGGSAQNPVQQMAAWFAPDDDGSAAQPYVSFPPATPD